MEFSGLQREMAVKRMNYQNNSISNQIYSVSGVNSLIKLLLDNCRDLKNIKIHGEISNYKIYSSGHHYFSIKDSSSVLGCVMFKSQAYTLKFIPDNGMSVIVSGTVSVYPRDGKYQLICDRIEPEGVGALQEAFEKMKNRLSTEGLFDDSLKKKLPEFPNRIALVTSPSGAAVRDMIRILNTRWPISSVIIVPVTVQGSTSSSDISEAIKLINRENLADLIIVGRGGGSLEDLWSFNEENVARAIFSSDIPVISAVGHEPDITISDYVADRRASTPSNAAEIAVPDIRDVRKHLAFLKNSLSNGLSRVTEKNRNRIRSISSKEAFLNPERRIQFLRQDLDHLRLILNHEITGMLNRNKALILSLSSGIDAMNPRNTLLRGFSVAVVNGHAVSCINEMSEGLDFKLVMADGEAECKVNRILENGADYEKG